MSFLGSSFNVGYPKNDTSSGTADPIDPYSILQFTGLGSIAKVGAGGVSAVFKKLAPNALSSLERLFVPRAATKAAAVGIAGGSGAAVAISQGVSKLATPFSFNKLLAGGVIFGIPTLGGILSLSPGGQELVKTTGQVSDNVAQIGKGVTNLFQSNPLILVGILGVVALMVLKK